MTLALNRSYLYLARNSVMNLVVVNSRVLPRYLFNGLNYVLANYVRLFLHRENVHNGNVLCNVNCFKVIMVYTVGRLSAILRFALVSRRAIRPRTRAKRVNHSAQCVRYRALREDVAPEFVVEDRCHRIVTCRRIVVIRIRSTVVAIRVAECRCRLRLIIHVIPRIMLLRTISSLIIQRLVRPVNGRQPLRQDIVFLATFRAFLRVLANTTGPTQRLSGNRGLLIRVLITREAIRDFRVRISALVARLVASTNDSGRRVVIGFRTRRYSNSFAGFLTYNAALTNRLLTTQGGVLLRSIRRRRVNQLIRRLNAFAINRFTCNYGAVRIIYDLALGKVFKLRIRFLYRLVTIMDGRVLVGEFIISYGKATSAYNVNHRCNYGLEGRYLSVRDSRANRPFIYLMGSVLVFLLRNGIVVTLRRRYNYVKRRKYFIVVTMNVGQIRAVDVPRPNVGVVLSNGVKLRIRRCNCKDAKGIPASRASVRVFLLFNRLTPDFRRILIFLR